jgi:hypothetical protein
MIFVTINTIHQQKNRMKKNYIPLALIAVLVLCCFGFKWAQNKKIKSTEQTIVIVNAAKIFLNSLSAEQRTKVLFDFERAKVATSAKFERIGNASRQGGGQGRRPNGSPQDSSAPPKDGLPNDGRPRNGPPAGAQGRGQFAGFIGEQYGKAVWSNFPVRCTKTWCATWSTKCRTTGSRYELTSGSLK